MIKHRVTKKPTEYTEKPLTRHIFPRYHDYIPFFSPGDQSPVVYYRKLGSVATEGMAFLNSKLDHLPVNDYVLECHNLSYIRSFTTGRWYTKLFNPPITAQFLKDVNLEVHGGEVMGIIGSGGCGKTTLLNVIARRVQGTTGGTILLNHRPMTERAFQNNCAYVSFKQALNPFLSVRQTLRYQADLSLAAALTEKEKSERVNKLMRDFELMDYGGRKVKKLNESARRRLLVAYHLVRDPLLILIDEPTEDMDALSAYQLMYNIFQYMKRNSRMAIVSATMPRSDIYQLFDRLTILFFGEVVYSGYTKQMPHYFRQIGYPCPATENPAVYYLSLATVDRETSERYLETQDQAVKLIEIFKTQGHPFSQYRGPTTEIYQPSPYLPYSHLGRPSGISKLFTLAKRNLRTYTSQTDAFLGRIFLLPAFAVLLFLFYFRLGTNLTAPQTRAGLIFNTITSSSLVSVALTASSFGIHRLRFYQESWDNLYGGVIFILSHLLVCFLIDLSMLFGTTAILYWGCGMGDGDPWAYLIFSGVVWCCFQFSQLQTISLMLFVKSSYNAGCISATLISIYLTWTAGFLKSLRTYLETPGAPTDWLYYMSYISLFRYAGSALNFQELRNLTVPCTPREYCRWDSGLEYLRETYPDSEGDKFWLNFALCFAFVGGFTLVTIILYSVPMPHFVKRKFRYK